jgi:hypothetical protein
MARKPTYVDYAGFLVYGVPCLQITGPTEMCATRRDDDDEAAWLMELIEYNRHVP